VLDAHTKRFICPHKVLHFHTKRFIRRTQYSHLFAASSVGPSQAVGDFERLEICLLKWRLLKIKAIRIR